MENIKMAISSLRAHKMRSLLTMLGIIIGVGSVIAVVAIGQGGEAVLKSQFAGEANTLSLFYMPTEEELQANDSRIYEDPFTQEDIELLMTIPEVKKVVASSTTSTNVRFRENQTDSAVVGMNHAYMDVYPLDIKEGRNLIAAEYLSGARVGIMTTNVVEELTGETEAPFVGEIVYVNGQPIEVVGVAEEETGLFSFGAKTIYVPMKTWQTIFAKKTITELSIQTETVDDLQIAGEKATALLNEKYKKEDAYQTLNMEEIAEGIGQVTRIMTIIISSIAGVSLLVGGIGVMNIMLVSVTERTREIGLRMSIGATRGQILFQFLVEAMTLTLIGGLIGIALGTGLSFVVSHFAGWPPLISLPVIIGGVLFSMLIGVVFGMLPANKAASLHPIDALRYE